LELIDLKGKAALDKAIEIAGELGRAPEEPTDAQPVVGSSGAAAQGAAGRGSARQGRSVGSELHLEQFQETVDLLEAFGVKFTIDFEIVRGLEYYSGTVFEIYAQGLGAQRQICGGGTYELASLFGGKETSSTGFGLGFDRIMEIVQMEGSRTPPVFLAFTPDVKMQAAKIAGSLRKSIPLVMDVMGRSLGAQLKAAASAGAKFVVIVGKDELDAGKLTLRDMAGGEQESLDLPAIEEKLKRRLQG
jgi:histidyl-tRNA synthetase